MPSPRLHGAQLTLHGAPHRLHAAVLQVDGTLPPVHGGLPWLHHAVQPGRLPPPRIPADHPPILWHTPRENTLLSADTGCGTRSVARHHAGEPQEGRMQKRLRKQLERASRVLVFCREHPSDLAGYQQAVARLEEQVIRADLIVGQARAGGTATREAMAERDQLRAEVNADLRLLARIARSAGQEAVGASIVIAFPNPSSSYREYIYGGRLAVAAAQEREDLLVRYGLPPEFLAGLSARLTELDRLLTRRDESTQARVFANRDLQVAISGLILSVAQLHAINSYRFRTNPAALRTWGAASDIRIGPRKPVEPVEQEAPPMAQLTLPAPSGRTPVS